MGKQTSAVGRVSSGATTHALQRRAGKIVTKNSITNYPASVPEQLLLFEFEPEEKKPYSQSIHLYDAVPKYTWGNQKRIQGKFLDPLEREFSYEGHMYRAIISPARIMGKDGIARDFFPSSREELVEDALRKLASEGAGIFLNNEAGAYFTLYQLRKELLRIGHGYNIPDIKEAILICAQTNMQVFSEDRKSVVVSNMFETLGLREWDDWKKHGNKSVAFVKFNHLVTQCIKDRTFRQINYDKCMSYKKTIARWLHKRISRHFIQADFTNSYTILFSTIIRDSGMKVYPQMRDNMRQIQDGLEEMKEKKVLREYHIEKILGGKRGRKLVDAKGVLYPHHNFVREMKLFNKNYRDLQSAKLNQEKIQREERERLKQLGFGK
jgi:hypothetical protein